MAACVRVAVQRAVQAAATLCWRMAGVWRALARAKLLMKAAASLHLPPALIASTTKRQRWLIKVREINPRDVFFFPPVRVTSILIRT